jgi:ABC-type antimicrobial peptide transport system permease subunit
VGERLRVNPSPAAPAGTAPTVRRVIGVVGDVRHVHTDDDLADVYVPMLQAPSAFAFMYLRARIDAPRLEQDVRGVLVAIDPDLALGMARPLGDILDQQRAGSRFLASLLVIFAAFAATLALVGIYGVIAYTVRQREREIALRLAIGAGRGVIVRLFLTQGAWVLGAGLALGAGGALLLGRVLESQLYGVPAADPMAIAAVGVAFAACGLAAMAWPARRAASTDPAIALKS